MAGILRKSFDAADETRPFEEDKGRLDVLTGGNGSVGRAVFEPGWQWSRHVKPIAGTDSCMVRHIGYVVSGRMKVAMDDGEAVEFGPGDFMEIEPGHDGWVLGDEPCVIVDWAGYSDYALPPSS
ncbi:cupin domain-containing protein [Streptomyces sp. NPDC058872]|uniref:cupin domain-containing protein n=1 Tax=Streptomyces sp. NPDC058872 TaxID=3346661 RepID=UPI0036A51C26